MNDGAPRLVVSLTQDFDVSEASRVARQIEGAIDGRSVLLDFAACPQADIFAVALLARAVEREGGTLQVRGLTRRAVRILGYLGVSLGNAASHAWTAGAADDDPSP